LAYFVWKERGVDAAEDHERAAGACHRRDRIAAKGVRGVDADADHVAGTDRVAVERVECFIDDVRRPEAIWSRGGEHVQPPRSDDGGPERHVAWIDEMYAHVSLLRRSRQSSFR